MGLLALLGVFAAGALLVGGRTIRHHALIVDSIPPRPVLQNWPVALEDSITAGELAANGYFRAMDGLIALSRLYHANGFFNEAIQCYAGLQQIEPREARWRHFQASILSGFGRLDEALPFEQQAVDLAPDYVAARLRLADILLKTNQTVAAANAYAEALRREPGNPYALLGLAKGQIVVGNWIQARENLRQVIKLHPDFIGGLSLLATVAEHLGDQAEADSLRAVIGKREFSDLSDPWLDALMEDCFDAYRLSVAAAVANSSGDTAAAGRHLERAITLAPASGNYHRQLGSLLLQARDYTPARQHLENAVRLAPGDSDAWILLFTLFSGMGDASNAEHTLEAGLSACPQSPALHYAYGHLLSGIGKAGEAISELETAKRLRPNEANAYIDLAAVYLRQGRMEDAMAELKGALAVQPAHPLALEVLARYAISGGDEPVARHWIQQLRLQPRVPAADLDMILAEFLERFQHAP